MIFPGRKIFFKDVWSYGRVDDTTNFLFHNHKGQMYYHMSSQRHLMWGYYRLFHDCRLQSIRSMVNMLRQHICFQTDRSQFHDSVKNQVDMHGSHQTFSHPEPIPLHLKQGTLNHLSITLSVPEPVWLRMDLCRIDNMMDPRPVFQVICLSNIEFAIFVAF